MSRFFLIGLLGLLGILAAGMPARPASAATEALRPFGVNSLSEILAARAGRPVIVSFWSISCTHCPSELKALGALRRRHPALDIVLVATDTPADAPELIEVARRHGLGGVEQWVFADPVPERLRAAIDRRWYGELPRTHFYDAAHRVSASSGVVSRQRLFDWARTVGGR